MGNPVSREETEAMIAKCKDFLLRVQGIIQEETKKWVAEFQAALKDVDEALRIAAEAAKEKAKIEDFGAIIVEVENGLECDDGWHLSLDGGTQRRYSGKRASLNGIRPGLITVVVLGAINGKKVQDSRPVKVLGGETSTVTLRLE